MKQREHHGLNLYTEAGKPSGSLMDLEFNLFQLNFVEFILAYLQFELGMECTLEQQYIHTHN